MSRSPSTNRNHLKVRYPILFSQDGNMVCATYHDFTNLQESPAGFGETRRLAMMALQEDDPLRCRQPLWWGYGAPAGHCGEKAFGSEVGSYKPATWRFPEQFGELWFEPQTARCPNHGGPTREKAIAVMLGEQ